MVIGVTGSGKSTAARAIAERFHLPYVSVDDLMWRPGWVPAPEEEQRAIIAEVCAGSQWVIDSAYGSWQDIPLLSVDLVVGLDIPRWVSYGQLLRRTVRRLRTKEVICNGNRETLRGQLSTDGLLVWHFRSFGRKRRRMRAWYADPQGPPVLLIRHRHELAAWLDAVSARPAASAE
jgi:hypothetical protein